MQEVAPRIVPARLAEELAQRLEGFKPLREDAMTGNRHDARVGSDLARVVQRHVEVVRVHDLLGALRPFDDDDRILYDVLPAELGELVDGFDAIEIGMHDLPEVALIDLHQREAGTGRLDLRVSGYGADERAGEYGLSDAELAAQSDDVAASEQGGEVRSERGGRRLAVHLDPPAAVRGVILHCDSLRAGGSTSLA